MILKDSNIFKIVLRFLKGFDTDSLGSVWEDYHWIPKDYLGFCWDCVRNQLGSCQYSAGILLGILWDPIMIVVRS